MKLWPVLLPSQAVSNRLKAWLRPCRRLKIAGLGVVLGLWLLAAPAQAQTLGGITVLDSRQEVDFPGGISFTLTAESAANITEVRLLYRTPGGDAWSYAYPGFIPAPRVTARLTLSIGGFNYLPPGAELEYYYIIRDAQGNVHQTASAVVEYTDSRFQWEQTQVGPLLLLYHDLRQSRVDAVAREVEHGLGQISSLLQIETGRPIKGIIYNQDAEAEAAFPRQSRTIDETHVFGGFAFPPHRVFIGVGFQARTIVHESAHLLLDQAVGPGALPLPSWLNEGFASYMEPGATPFSGKSLSSRGLPLRAMTRVSGTPQNIATFYLKAESVVAYLIEEYGVEPFQQLVATLSEGGTTEEALLEAYGFGVDELESRWASDATRPPAPAPGSPTRGSPWLSFSSLLLGALAVAVAGSMLLQYAIRKLRPASGSHQGPDGADLDDDYYSS